MPAFKDKAPRNEAVADSVRLGDMIDAARGEKWKKVDKIIPTITDNPFFYRWAYSEGIRDDNGNVRDLAASIIEKSKIPKGEFFGMRDTLIYRMLIDRNQYVKYRLAFALAEHGTGFEHFIRQEIIRVLNDAKKDNDVGNIAKGYLKKLGEEA
jgi:hypothetical protein